MSTIGVDDATYSDLHDDTVDWSLVWDPSSWYVTPELVKAKYESLLISLGASAAAIVIYFVFYMFGRNWWASQRKSRVNFSDSTTNLLWVASHIPLALSAWIVYLENDEEWCRALTYYSIQLGVNAAYPFSLYMIRDFSLAVMNLIILIGLAMVTQNQFGSIYAFCSSCNSPYLLFLFVYLVQFLVVWYFNEGKMMMKDMMKEGFMKHAFALSSSHSRSRFVGEKKKKSEKFPGGKRALEKLLKKQKKDKDREEKKKLKEEEEKKAEASKGKKKKKKKKKGEDSDDEKKSDGKKE